MAFNKKSLENLKKRNVFPKAPQGLDENKSQGQINLSREKNILKTLRLRINETNIIEDLVNGIAVEASDGYFKNALKLLEVVKEPEKNETVVNINQAVQVNKDDINEAVKIINELR